MSTVMEPGFKEQKNDSKCQTVKVSMVAGILFFDITGSSILYFF